VLGTDGPVIDTGSGSDPALTSDTDR
jgi:hypothetical protein